MNDIKVLLTQTRYSLMESLRTSAALVFGVVFPLVLLVVFNSVFVPGTNQNTGFAGGTISTTAYFTAGLTAYAIATQAFASLIIALTDQRESGQLKRLRGTPMPVWTFIAALVLRVLIMAVVMATALFLAGDMAYGVHLRAASMLGILVYTLLGGAAMCTLGIAATVLARTSEAAAALGPFTVVILSFVSGVFIAVTALPHWLRTVGQVFPLYHLAEGLQRAAASTHGSGLNTVNIMVLLAWTVAGTVAGLVFFRWEPLANRRS